MVNKHRQESSWLVTLRDFRLPARKPNTSTREYTDRCRRAFEEQAGPVVRLIEKEGGSVEDLSWLAGAVHAVLPAGAQKTLKGSSLRLHVERAADLTPE